MTSNTARGQWPLIHFCPPDLPQVSFWPNSKLELYRERNSGRHQFTHSVVSDSLWRHGLQHTRLPCPSATPRAYSNSVMPFNHLILCHCLLLLSSIFPSIRVFPMSQFFASGGQSIGVSASASVLPMNIQDWFPLGWTSWISLQSRGLSRVFSNTTVQKHQFFGAQLSLWSISHIHTWLLEKP